MDKLLKYREIINQILHDNAQPDNHSNDVKPQVICDRENDHYQLMYVGWEDQKRVLALVLHFDIKDGKIWVQYNGTELPIARILTEKGVPESDIVLGFHSPFKRQFSGYAVS